MKDFWNDRYGKSEWAYGEAPNEYFKHQLVNFKPGKILLPAEGEGRNAVYAAKMGWEVSAFDMSRSGKAKAEQLARKNGVQIDYQVGGLNEVSYPAAFFDCIGLIYAHFPAAVKSNYHKALNEYVRIGGVIIFEAFSKSHLKFSAINPKAGGPKDEDMLFSVDEIKKDFSNYDIVELVEREVTLNEGLYHIGMSSVVRFVGIKNG